MPKTAAPIVGLGAITRWAWSATCIGLLAALVQYYSDTLVRAIPIDLAANICWRALDAWGIGPFLPWLDGLCFISLVGMALATRGFQRATAPQMVGLLVLIVVTVVLTLPVVVSMAVVAAVLIAYILYGLFIVIVIAVVMFGLIALLMS